jgi:hypothetical protein
MHFDPDVNGSAPIPDKEAAILLLHELLGKEPYIPKPKPIWENDAREGEAPAEPNPLPEIEKSAPVSATVIADRLRMRLREKKEDSGK